MESGSPVMVVGRGPITGTSRGRQVHGPCRPCAPTRSRPTELLASPLRAADHDGIARSTRARYRERCQCLCFRLGRGHHQVDQRSVLQRGRHPADGVDRSDEPSGFRWRCGKSGVGQADRGEAVHACVLTAGVAADVRRRQHAGATALEAKDFGDFCHVHDRITVVLVVHLDVRDPFARNNSAACNGGGDCSGPRWQLPGEHGTRVASVVEHLVGHDRQHDATVDNSGRAGGHLVSCSLGLVLCELDSKVIRCICEVFWAVPPTGWRRANVRPVPLSPGVHDDVRAREATR